jgi:hypothetical protein
MKPFLIRVSRLIDFGTIVSLVGTDIETGDPITVHVDHRPVAAFWTAWQDAGLPQPIEYDADKLTLSLAPVAEDDVEEPCHG